MDKPQNEQSLYGLRYAEFVVPLVKAVQELTAVNEAQSAAIKDSNAAHSAAIGELKLEIAELKALVGKLSNVENPGNK